MTIKSIKMNVGLAGPTMRQRGDVLAVPGDVDGNSAARLCRAGLATLVEGELPKEEPAKVAPEENAAAAPEETAEKKPKSKSKK